jgi:hypothetical protein
LELTIGYNVKRNNLANLNDAVNQARREEETKNELIRKTTGIDIRQTREKEMEEILKEETRKYKEPNSVIDKFNKEVTKDDIDDLMKKFEKMEAYLMKRNDNSRRNNNQRSYLLRNNNRKDQFDYNQLICYICKERGSTSTVCQMNQRNRGNNRN